MNALNIDLTTSSVKHRVAKDLARRIFSGVMIYPLLWLIIGFGSELHTTHNILFWLSFAGLTLLSGARALHIRWFSSLQPEKVTRWSLQLKLLMLPHTLTWGCLFGFALTMPNSTFVLLMTFGTAGVVPGGIYNFAPDFKLSLMFILSMLLPALITSSFISQEWYFFLMLLVYALFIINMAYGQNKDFWNHLEKQLTLEAQSRTDALTQLENRRYFDEKLDEFCHLSSRNHEKLTVMLVDCDLFKSINDNYGHDIGDQCLQHIATLLKKALPRVTDVCARYGGEEFSIILPGTDLEGAQLVGERIRQIIESHPFKFNDGDLSVTVSIGSVSRQINKFIPELPFDLFKQADKALYQAKANGRNQCVYFHFEQSTSDYQYAATTPKRNEKEASSVSNPRG